jgi:osmotically inducible protein OsmC
MEEIYAAVVTAKGGRNGYIRSADGAINMKLKDPETMGGEGGYPNPELLFAGAWASCYLSSLNVVAQTEKTDVSDATVQVHIGFNKESENSYELTAAIYVNIPGANKRLAQRLAEAAHNHCPYSKVTRFNVDVKIMVNENVNEQLLVAI